jgi:hypothetical protein
MKDENTTGYEKGEKLYDLPLNAKKYQKCIIIAAELSGIP